MRFLLSFLFLFTFGSLIAQQNWKLVGSLMDGETPLSFGTVYAVPIGPDSTTILAFATTNDNGSFELKIDTFHQGVHLICNYLGFQKHKLRIDQKTKQPLVIQMLAASNELQEVIVKERKLAINTRGDTIRYNLSAFRDSTEDSIEDILKKLPGIQVEENGQILVGGKAIEKMMIEGTDMFGRQYTIGSKNIRADLIESVEIIDHYQENSVVKDIISSEAVVLNLKLKDKVKGIFAGVVTAGLGYGDEFKFGLNSNVFSIAKKYKALLITDNGNNGDQYGSEELDAIYPSNNDQYNVSDPIQQSARFTNKSNLNYLNFKRSFVDNSKSTFTTLRSYFDLGTSVKVNLNAYYSAESDAQRSIEQQSYLYESAVFENNFEQRLQLKNKLSKFDFKLNQVNAKNTQSFECFFEVGDSKHVSSRIFNSPTDTEYPTLTNEWHLEDKKMFAAGLYTLKLGENSLLSVLNKNSLSNRPENFEGNNPDYALLFPTVQPFNEMRQRIDFRNRLHEFSASYYYRINSFLLRLESSLLLTKYRFGNRQTLIDTNEMHQALESFEVLESQFDRTLVNRLTLTKTVGRNTKLSLDVSSFSRNLRVGAERVEFDMKDGVSVSISGNKVFDNELKLFASYGYQQVNLPNYHFIPSSYFSDAFNYKERILNNRQPSGHHFNARLSRINTARLSSFYIAGNASVKQSRWINDVHFQNSIYTSSPYFSDNNASYSLYGKWEYFIPRLKMNVELLPAIYRNESDFVVGGQKRDNLIHRFRLDSRISLNLTHHIRWSVNAMFSRTYFQVSTPSDASQTAVTNVRIDPYFSMKLGDWHFGLSAFYANTYNDSQNASLLGSNLKIKKTVNVFGKKSNLSLQWNNLLNTKSYSRIYSSDYFTSNYQIEALPTFFVFTFDYAF